MVNLLKARIQELKARNGRLRKAVNWLRGANHDGGEIHQGTVETCEVWECRRARDILAEEVKKK